MSTIINATTTNGVVIQPDNSGSLVLQTNSGTTALTISTAQNVTFAAQATIPTINLTGGQIAFPATQSASANANTLDDYEEGTWTPTLTNCVSGTVSNTNYVKIGNVVTARLSIAGGTYTLNSSRFTLPFTSVALQSGTFTNGTVRGGFIEAQASNVCYFATTDSGTVNCTITYITS